eukprot:scaffold140738_cov31-Tisochrysis_lutea.AAC.5
MGRARFEKRVGWRYTLRAQETISRVIGWKQRAESGAHNHHHGKALRWRPLCHNLTSAPVSRPECDGQRGAQRVTMRAEMRARGGGGKVSRSGWSQV